MEPDILTGSVIGDEAVLSLEVFALSFISNDGVGLAREEFIISTYIQVHPLALLD